jgi:hypothetical protein
MDIAARQLPAFEPFEVRRRRSFFEIMHRLVRVGFPLYLWLAFIGTCTGSLRTWPQNRDLLPLALLVFLPLALIFTFLAVPRFVYWRIDHAGIHQRCLGFRNWDLAWNAIVSRTVGPDQSKRWVVIFPFVIFPIMGGPYQAILLYDRAGRTRKFNRLATNGDKLDELIRHYLNPTREAEFSERYSQVMRAAQAKHEHSKPVQALLHHQHPETVQPPLHFVTRETPPVRVKWSEPNLPLVCCNCLGPATVRAAAGIGLSPRLIGYALLGIGCGVPPSAKGFAGASGGGFVLLGRVFGFPLCAACHARTSWSGGSWVKAFVAGILLLMAGVTSVGFLDRPKDGVWWGIWSASSWIAFLGVVIWGVMRDSSPSQLAKVARVNTSEDWAEVRFGNPDYARLVSDLNEEGLA